MDISRVLNIATYAGKIILENGGEIYRVEETIIRICNAYNIKIVEPFATPTAIIVSASSEYGQNISIIKRIKKRSLNLEKISQVNDISRNIKNKGFTLEYIESELHKVENSKSYSIKVNILFSGITAAFFALVFGGNLRDFFVSFIIGCLIKSTSTLLGFLQTNDFFVNTLCGALAALVALLSVHLGIGAHADKIIIGSIMLLVPGLAITNAIRDTIAGDLIAGISRGVEAFLIAIAIAVGTGATMKIWFLLLEG
ncbi:threonine/serine exporter family protein [Clostridium sp. CX1]|uniref:Threonine/serine exporter family protein n=1 Tax=Clostridium tanneri TaxID=3037988 RepID=A0ABU4JN02_9CLOT|nr:MULTISPECIES: threonine/serine exporter family protein [unclassified Clostridium]MCT8975982.1 threonine/serine exporter family protein [Clostridium sp. CX1]MDW8799534.1 threonine/serine exporter family protein [Clostridium sp. A1-XYC3]